MKELYNAPEVEVVRFAPALAIADNDDIPVSEFDNELGGEDF